jgi:hypothetical protein
MLNLDEIQNKILLYKKRSEKINKNIIRQQDLDEFRRKCRAGKI